MSFITVRPAIDDVGLESRRTGIARLQRVAIPMLACFLSVGCASSTSPSSNGADSPVQGACSFSVAGDASSLTVGAASVILPVSVATTAGCVWSVETQADFITIADIGGGSGDGAVRLSVAPNSGGQRSGKVSIARVAITITQTGPSVVDQSFLQTRAAQSGSFAASLYPVVSQGQTFTAAVGGQLTGADIAVGFVAFGGPPADVVVQVRNTSGGLPVSNILTSGRIPASAVPEDASIYTHVEFAPAVSVTAGQMLALTILNEDGSKTSINMSCLGTTGADYSGGNWIVSSGGSPWELGKAGSAFAQGDLFFRTYVAR